MKQMASTSKTQRTSTSSIGFAEKLIFQGHWFRREAGFAGEILLKFLLLYL